jgi:hypothetical protein
MEKPVNESLHLIFTQEERPKMKQEQVKAVPGESGLTLEEEFSYYKTIEKLKPMKPYFIPTKEEIPKIQNEFPRNKRLKQEQRLEHCSSVISKKKKIGPPCKVDTANSLDKNMAKHIKANKAPEHKKLSQRNKTIRSANKNKEGNRNNTYILQVSYFYKL